MFEFFYGNEVEQYQFYRVSQALFTNEKFSKISCESKLLYGFLLDRCGLSKKNKWCDKDGRLYVFFKQDEACEKLNIGKDKAVKIFNELEKIGLINRKNKVRVNQQKFMSATLQKKLTVRSIRLRQLNKKAKSRHLKIRSLKNQPFLKTQKQKSRHLKKRSLNI